MNYFYSRIKHRLNAFLYLFRGEFSLGETMVAILPYSWRNALLKNIISMNEKHDELDIVLLDQYHAKEYIHQGSVVIDAGANVGIFSRFAARLGATVYAFEPAENTYRILLERTKNMSSITCFNKGLGDEISEKVFINLGAGDVGSVMEDSEFAKGKQGERETVHIATIDSLNLSHVDFIKIDTEGYEKKVLLGAAKTIKRDKPIIVMSAYHNPGDKEVLPATIKAICPEYACRLSNRVEEDFICGPI